MDRGQRQATQLSAKTVGLPKESKQVHHLTQVVAAAVFAAEMSVAGQAASPPIIDMHLHAERLDSYIAIQADTRWMPKNLARPSSDEALMSESMAALRRHNIVLAVTSEELDQVALWQQAEPDRILPALLCMCTSESELTEARKGIGAGRIKVLGEVPWQYAGLSPSASEVEPVWKLAEEFDIPLAIHLGPTPFGWSQTVDPAIRLANGSPLLLEEALTKYPKVRVYVMHAGWPFLDEMVAMLYQYPELYVDVAWINWYIEKAEFHRYLRRLVDAGFGDRIMFGSDQMQWPGSIGLAIQRIESAEFLTSDQKRDVFYNNAARFLRLSEDEIARHHGR